MGRVDDYRNAVTKAKNPEAANAVWLAAINEAAAGGDQSALNEIMVDHPSVMGEVVDGQLVMADNVEQRLMREKYEWGGGTHRPEPAGDE